MGRVIFGRQATVVVVLVIIIVVHIDIVIFIVIGYVVHIDIFIVIGYVVAAATSFSYALAACCCNSHSMLYIH